MAKSWSMGKSPEAGASTVVFGPGKTPYGWKKEDYRNMVRQGLRGWQELDYV